MAARRGPGLTVRFFMAMMLVAAAGGATAVLVAFVAAPRLFHQHLHNAMPAVSTDVVEHADSAFWSANALGIALALPAALVTSLAASLFLSRRLRGATRTLAVAASEVASGRYDARVRAGALGSEFDEVAGAFNQMAVQLQRTEESRRRLLADVTHELRTPVATLNAYVEGLEDGIVSLDATTGAVLRAQATRIARLTDDMAALSEAGDSATSLELRHTSAEDLIHSAVTGFTDRYARRGVTLRSAVPGGLPLVDVDPERMGQVLGNLLDNALRHTPPSGCVTVTARRAGDAIDFTVEDSGDGILAEHLPLIFDRFYRVDTARHRGDGGGSGIGLAITKALVQAHGGWIRALSDGPGHGSTFIVSLPASP